MNISKKLDLQIKDILNCILAIYSPLNKDMLQIALVFSLAKYR